MIDTKYFYLVDDLVLLSYCPNTSKVSKKEKFVLFKDHLHTIQPYLEIYENDLNSYVCFIFNSIIRNALELKKNILLYEQYFFNSISGYISKFSLKNQTAHIARYWTELLNVYNQILSEINADNVKTVEFFKINIKQIRYINYSQVNNNYYYEIPIHITTIDDQIINIIIIPNFSNIYSNLLVLNLIKDYPIKNSLRVITLDLKSSKILYQNIQINNKVISYVNNYFEKYYIDFNITNITQCCICPLSCTLDEMHYVVQPTTSQKIRKIKLINK